MLIHFVQIGVVAKENVLEVNVCAIQDIKEKTATRKVLILKEEPVRLESNQEITVKMLFAKMEELVIQELVKIVTLDGLVNIVIKEIHVLRIIVLIMENVTPKAANVNVILDFQEIIAHKLIFALMLHARMKEHAIKVFVHVKKDSQVNIVKFSALQHVNNVMKIKYAQDVQLVLNQKIMNALEEKLYVKIKPLLQENGDFIKIN